jgi:uncharacterized protein (TIGR02466 family)
MINDLKIENEQNVIFPLFSKIIFATDTKYKNNQLRPILQEIKIKKFKKVSHSAFMSEDIHVLNSKNLKTLKKMLEQKVEIYTNSFLRYKNKFQITTSWFTNVKKEGYSEYHNHSNSMFSGTFYIQANVEQDKIAFENYNNPTWLLEPVENTIYNCRQYNFNVHPGLLILFPSETYHRIQPNLNSEERISLAFNIIPKGFIGSNDNSLNLIKCK